MNKLKELINTGNSFCIGCRSQEQQDAIAKMLIAEGIGKSEVYTEGEFTKYPMIFVFDKTTFTNQSFEFTKGCIPHDGNLFWTPVHPFVAYLQDLISGFTTQHAEFKRMAEENIDNQEYHLYYSSMGSGIWDRKCDAEKVLSEFYRQFPEFKIDAAEASPAI